ATVAIGGVVLIAATVPNATQLLRFFPQYKKGAKFNYQAKSALGRLAAKGYVEFIEKKGRKFAQITELGERALEGQAQKPRIRKRWDRRWRVVIFDIPERRRSTRTRFRRYVEEYGFMRLQDSVWVYPYDCEDLVALMKTDLRIGADVLYMIVE